MLLLLIFWLFPKLLSNLRFTNSGNKTFSKYCHDLAFIFSMKSLLLFKCGQQGSTIILGWIKKEIYTGKFTYKHLQLYLKVILMWSFQWMRSFARGKSLSFSEFRKPSSYLLGHFISRSFWSWQSHETVPLGDAPRNRQTTWTWKPVSLTLKLTCCCFYIAKYQSLVLNSIVDPYCICLVGFLMVYCIIFSVFCLLSVYDQYKTPCKWRQ